MLEQEEVQIVVILTLHLVKRALDLVVEVLPDSRALMSLLVLVGLVLFSSHTQPDKYLKT